MKITRIYTGEDGESHFEDLELAEDATQRRATTDAIDADRVAFGLSSQVLPPQDWHPAPRRQLVALLSGAMEIEVGNGEKRRFNTGDSFIADDLTGRGHRTSDLGDPVNLLYVHLPEHLVFSRWRTGNR